MHSNMVCTDSLEGTLIAMFPNVADSLLASVLPGQTLPLSGGVVSSKDTEPEMTSYSAT